MSTLNLSAALSIFSDHLPDIRKACVQNAQAIQATPYKEWDVDTEPATKEAIHLHANHLSVRAKIAPLERTIKRIDGRKRHYSGQSITDADIDRAREYPIQELWRELIGTPIRHGMVSCPFHDDNTPSMSLRKHNRYKCFSCDAKGDVIDLYMKVQGCGFLDAIRGLVR